VVNTGRRQHVILSCMLSLVFELLPMERQSWPTMPALLPGFQAHILNASNTHSLISLLPGPNIVMINSSHAYCSLPEFTAWVLLLPRTIGVAPMSKRTHQLCRSKAMLTFMQDAPRDDPHSLVSVGFIFWLDGWDPSASSKNNRSPIHTALVTLLLLDNATHLCYNCWTYPISCGPGKVDHNSVFSALRGSLEQISSTPTHMFSHFHHGWTKVRTQVMALLMDQPERRQSTGLLGGNGKQHPLFGVSCNFMKLQKPFLACRQCLLEAKAYLATATYAQQMHLKCSHCYSYSLSRLLDVGKRNHPLLPWLPSDAPGYSLASAPGILSFALLIAGWQYAKSQFVVSRLWSQNQVEDYFGLLCINKATTDNFTECCRNHLLLQDMAAHPNEYDDEELASVPINHQKHPHLYIVPGPPSAWHIGTMNQRVGTIMHLAMNTQKAVLKLVLHWASSNKFGPALYKQLGSLIQHFLTLRLLFLPIQKFKNDKFGGYVAENY